MDAKHAAVEALLNKASGAKEAAQAVNFAQAACSAANALRVINDIEHPPPGCVPEK